MTKACLTILGFSIMVLAACGNTGDDGGGASLPSAPIHPDKIKLVYLVNELRAEGQACGAVSLVAAGAVTWSDTLAAVAKKHSQNMLDNDKLNHVGTDGSLVDQRLTDAGYRYTFYAENLLKGGETEEDAIQFWLNSTAHCENLMDPNIREIGVGTAGPYWTMVLASR